MVCIKITQVQFPGIFDLPNYSLTLRPKVEEIQWFLGFHGPPTPADQIKDGFDKGRSVVVK